MNQTLLVELFTEELPPKALAKLGASFAQSIFDTLKKLDFVDSEGTLTWYASPRRLAAAITDVRPISLEKEETIKIMPVSIGLDQDGKPTTALLKKLQGLGIPEEKIEQFEHRDDGKSKTLFYSRTVSGGQLSIVLPGALEVAIGNLPIPKVMSYQRPDGETVHFVRPVHRIIALYGAEIINLSLLGLNSNRTTLGHRFLSEGEISIAHADDYAANLASQGKVIANVTERKEKIRTALLAKAGNDQVLMPESLLDEVTALVEWPVVYECHFEDEFLAVPQECLILTMQTNQKYFALTDANGKLRSRFLIVSNLETTTPEHIIQGNERVVRPRLSDAKFFFEQDKKKTLESRLPMLANVVYHNKLGSQAERTQRVKSLAGKIAQALGADVALAERGALLAKADLLTDMVGEFPELQGIMGRYYALHDGEHAEVAAAASEHYQPRFAGDALPATATGTAVALADKLETLVGIWGIGLQPTGDRDPFALRRHAIGILRILLDKELPLSIKELVEQTAVLFGNNSHFKIPSEEVTDFLYERLRGLLRGYDGNDDVIKLGERLAQSLQSRVPNAVEAIVSQRPEYLGDIPDRLQAVLEFAALPESAALAAANKRITNILKKSEGTPGAVQVGLLQEAAEQALYNAMTKVKPEVDAAFAQGDFTSALKTLAALRSEVDHFFNDVMVNADDLALRNNRLALLNELHGMLNQVADISKLVV